MLTIDVIGAATTANRFLASIPLVHGAKEHALLRAALVVQTRAMIKAPVDTGFLRGNINSELTNSDMASVISSANYSIYQEFGTVRMAAHPYMRPALDESKEDIKAIVGEEVAAAVQGSVLSARGMVKFKDAGAW